MRFLALFTAFISCSAAATLPASPEQVLCSAASFIAEGTVTNLVSEKPKCMVYSGETKTCSQIAPGFTIYLEVKLENMIEAKRPSSKQLNTLDAEIKLVGWQRSQEVAKLYRTATQIQIGNKKLFAVSKFPEFNGRFGVTVYDLEQRDWIEKTISQPWCNSHK